MLLRSMLFRSRLPHSVVPGMLSHTNGMFPLVGRRLAVLPVFVEAVDPYLARLAARPIDGRRRSKIGG